MKLNTRHFGEIDYDENLAIDFTDGLPGFQDTKKYILLANESDALFFWLQSIDDGDVAFALMNVYQVISDYNPLVDEDELASLGEISGTELLIYNIAVIPEDIKQMRVNLKAPVIINPTSKRGKQVILNNDEYGVKYYIFDELKKLREQGQ